MKESNKKNFKYFIILHIVLAVYSFLSLFSKLAAGEKFLSLKFIIYYGLVVSGLFIYAVVWQQLLKKLPLVTAYANKAVTVIWGIVWGLLFFQELVTVKKLIGAAVIIAGVYLVVSSDNEDGAEKDTEAKDNTNAVLEEKETENKSENEVAEDKSGMGGDIKEKSGVEEDTEKEDVWHD